MKKSLWIVIFLALGLVGVLYSLPKVVVNSKTEETVANRSTPSPDSPVDAASGSNHTAASLTPEQTSRIERLRATYLAQEDPAQRYQAAVALSDAFGGFQRFDSAAFYAGLAADLMPSTESWLRAGDRYYEAFGFVMDEGKSNEYGEKTRSFYQKALDTNPSLLAAKANMAMTYVNTASPSTRHRSDQRTSSI